jgi:uncharacterized protein YjbI with pentapeptide repeats
MDPKALKQLFHALEARRNGLASSVEMPGCDLRGAHLLRADLVAADFSGARLDHANLAGAKLGRAKLEGTTFVGADLNGADLTGAELHDANLEGVRLEGVCFADADLCGASLSLATGMPSSVAGVRIDWQMCEKSGFDDALIVRWHRLGAILDKLEDFSESVRHACSTPSLVPGMPAPDVVLRAEIGARRAKLARDTQKPPSALHADGFLRLSLPPTQRRSLAPPADASAEPEELLQAVIKASLPPRQKSDVLGVELGEELTAGGVWQGRNADGETVLVRVCNPEKRGALGVAAFQRGVRAMNRAAIQLGDEPGMLRILAVGITELEIVTDYLPNGSLQNAIALNLPTRERVQLFIKLCKIVARLHDAGILHRCLKPSNVLFDARLEPVLSEIDMVDVATLAAEDDTAGGHAAYAAPEEVLGTGTQSPTADIYSLGRLLHFLLQGSDPDEPLEDVPKLEALRKQPAGLIRIIRKCTLRDPGARYQWVSELIEDLSRYETYDEVGIAGTTEANFLPYSISSLAPPPLARIAVGAYRAPPLAPTKVGALPKADWPWLERRAEILVAFVAGIAGCGLLGALLFFDVPRDYAHFVGYGAALGVALTSFALPRFRTSLAVARVTFAILTFLVVTALKPQSLATLRWRHQLSAQEPSVRASAVPRLTRAGMRDFAGVDLSGTVLRGVDLSQADFRSARFVGSDISRSALMESDFQGADLTNARAMGADFTGSNVQNAEGFDSIECDSTTSLPAGWLCADGRPAQASKP